MAGLQPFQQEVDISYEIVDSHQHLLRLLFLVGMAGQVPTLAIVLKGHRVGNESGIRRRPHEIGEAQLAQGPGTE